MALTNPPLGTDAALRILVTETEAGTHVALAGELLAREADWSRAVLDRVVDESTGSVVVDCGDLTYADSGGLATLYGTQRRARGQGRDWRIRGVAGQPRRALQLTGFDALLPLDRRGELRA